jgi:hypothetical protein
MRDIKEVRYELMQWGSFWARQEEGKGWSSKSNIQQLRETLQTGCSIQGTGHLVNHCSDSIYVPKHIEIIDEAIAILHPKCKVAIRQRYINKGRILYFDTRKDFLFWVLKAERELL